MVFRNAGRLMYEDLYELFSEESNTV